VSDAYSRRLAEAAAALVRAQSIQRSARAGLAAAVFLFIILSGYAMKKDIAWAWPVLAAAGGVLAGRTHARSGKAAYRWWRVNQWYRRALARVTSDWEGSGESGEEFEPAGHVYARDLNVFGVGSLFELLSIARSGVGRQGLADYLLRPASPEEIRARQQAVRELRGQTELRERMALLGKSASAQSNGATFAAWLKMPAAPFPRWFRAAIAATSIYAAVVIVCGLLGLLPWIVTGHCLLPVLALHTAAGLAVRSQVNRMILSSRLLAGETGVVQEGLALMAAQRFDAPKLAALSDRVSGAAAYLGRLEFLLRILEERHKEWFYLPGLVVMLGTQVSAAVESWRIRHGAALAEWLEAWAEFEALNCLAAYSYENPNHVFPEIDEGPARFEARALGHPLLPDDGCVRNDVALSQEARFYVISGSNMAGKSTLLRAIGLNAVLAQAGAPVRADSMRLSPLAVCASIATVDSLLQGKSKFLAEVERLREAIQLANAERPVLFLIDEIFSGTNSRDRRVAAEAVIRALVERGAIGALSTHDLALSEIAGDEMAGVNVHMGSRNGTDPMDFDYRLKPGVTKEANALAIARMAGVPI